MRYCLDSLKSIAIFIRYGLHPGSFCESLLLGDEERQFYSAHQLLKTTGALYTTMTFVYTNVPVVGIMDTKQRIYNWEKHRGLHGCNDEHIARVFNTFTNQWWNEFNIPNID